MKTILYMGISANGYIAKADGNSEWTSDENLKGFYEHSKKAGNIIMGKNTYLVALQYGYFPFPDSLNIVVSHEQIKNTWGDNVIVTSDSPKEILSMLEQKGFTEAFLAGGGQLNTSFAKEKLIDEIYLDVEPVILGQGIKIFADADLEFWLELLDFKKLNSNTVQLHYRVIKND
ncbi:MAG: dihydrofolate reductase family protein [Candidatus Azambacteria bacterium]|nr:dihydrofolate reductase family protein [Candidatus Azambacteria bacterium]